MSHGLKLWIDNIEEPPDDTWEWVTTSEAAIATLDFFSDEGMLWCPREAISFTYSLAGDDTTVPVLAWMVKNKFYFDHYMTHCKDLVKNEWLVDTIDANLRNSKM